MIFDCLFSNLINQEKEELVSRKDVDIHYELILDQLKQEANKARILNNQIKNLEASIIQLKMNNACLDVDLNNLKKENEKLLKELEEKKIEIKKLRSRGFWP